MYKIIYEKIKINSIPLHQIKINHNLSQIEFDDIEEQRWCINFKTIFAWKLTHIELYNNKIFEIIKNQRPIIEVEDSSWKDILKNNTIDLSKDEYIKKAKHYLFILDEDVVEVLSLDNFSITKV